MDLTADQIPISLPELSHKLFEWNSYRSVMRSSTTVDTWVLDELGVEDGSMSLELGSAGKTLEQMLI
jgi:hypothetical protein